MGYKRTQPPMPDDEPKATCPHFDAAIAEIEKAREANSSMREIIDQWRKQAEYWEIRCEDLTGELEEMKNENDELHEKIQELQKWADSVA